MEIYERGTEQERERERGQVRGTMIYDEKGMKIYPFLWNVEAWNKDALTSLTVRSCFFAAESQSVAE